VEVFLPLCLIDRESGEVIEEGRLHTTPEALRRRFASGQPMRIAIEAGTHSPWVSPLLEGCGHEVLVANASKLRLIYSNKRKTHEVDASRTWLAWRLSTRSSCMHSNISAKTPRLPCNRPLAREALVGRRTQLVKHVRAAVKSFAGRLPKCPARSFHNKAPERTIARRAQADALGHDTEPPRRPLTNSAFS
jgi:transposase